MFNEARRLNAVEIETGHARFDLYDGGRIPFGGESFDRGFGVNTIYFWREPETLLGELYRVLRPGGLLAIAFAQKSFMRRLPFVRELFRLYDDGDFMKLVAPSRFRLESLKAITEEVRGKTGELVEREFTVGLLRKPLRQRASARGCQERTFGS